MDNALQRNEHHEYWVVCAYIPKRLYFGNPEAEDDRVYESRASDEHHIFHGRQEGLDRISNTASPTTAPHDMVHNLYCGTSTDILIRYR